MGTFESQTSLLPLYVHAFSTATARHPFSSLFALRRCLCVPVQRPTAVAREQHKVMPPWKPVPIVDSDELLALKTNLNAQFNDIAAGSMYALE